MKIGIFTENLSRWGKGRYKMLKSLGYSCIDYNMADADTPPYTFSEKEFLTSLLAEKVLLEQAGMEISQVHGPWCWPPKDATQEERAERMDKMRTSIRATAILGGKNWIVHPIMPFGIEDIGTGKEQQTWDLNMAFMTELLTTAKEYDVTICLENMPMTKFSLGAPKDILRFVKTINDNSFKICLDTGHVAVFPGLSPADALRELGDEVRTLHIHDNDGRFDLHRMPYYGVIDWKDFGKALKEVRFQGAFSLETAPPETMPLPAAKAMYGALLKLAETVVG